MDDGSRCGIYELHPRVPEERRKEFVSYVEAIIEAESYAFDPNFLGFIRDYIAYNDLIAGRANLPLGLGQERPPTTVYDVGCAHALQHLVFAPWIHYVGIDVSETGPGVKFFRDNCTFIKGAWRDVAPTLKIQRECAVGIANMSLIYFAGPDEIELFDRTFKRKFVV